MSNFKDVGRLTKAPEIKFVGNGKAVANFTVAVERSYLNKDDKKEVDFHLVEVWGKVAEACTNNLDKGRLVLVEGVLQNNNYEDKETNKMVYGYKIVAESVKFLDYPKKDV